MLQLTHAVGATAEQRPSQEREEAVKVKRVVVGSGDAERSQERAASMDLVVVRLAEKLVDIVRGR